MSGAECSGLTDDLALLNLAEARRRIARLLQENQPLPDDLHERALRLELAAAPFDIDITASLIALLHRLGCAPVPEHSNGAASAMPERAVPAVEQLLEEAVIHAQAGDIFRDYACLWQIVVRYPNSARGWAEYARRFGERREWKCCRLALSRALASPEPPDLGAAVSILNALRSLAFHRQIEGVEWQSWVDQLPENLEAHPLIAELMLWTGNLGRAAAMLPPIVRSEPPEADSWIVAANIAYEHENWTEAYQYWRRAFEVDLSRTLRSAVVDHSARLSFVLRETGQADELADWLSTQWESHQGVNLIPPRWCPESERNARLLRERAIERGLPSVLFVAQPKSASASVGNLFSSGFGLAPAVYSLILHRVVAPWLTDYLRGGACYVTHLFPTERNIALLAAGGAPNIIVHVRDPRQLIVSVAGHIQNYAAERPPSMRSRGGLQDMIAAIISENGTQLVGWIDGWVFARAKLQVDFTTYEEFVDHRDSFIDRCLSLYGGDRRYFDRQVALGEHAGIDYHRRSGRTDEWREILTPEQVEQINRLIPDRLWNLFGWNP